VRRLLLGLFLIGLLWAIGFAAFLGRLPAPAADAPLKTDAVVIYTGGGGARIAAGMALFANGAGERLLISGVNPGTSRARLSELWEGAPDLFECCVDLDREALTTEGNAKEVSDWAQSHQYENLTLVTSDYHMPRALLVTRARMAGVEITPYVVASGYLDDNGRPSSATAWKKLSGEYTKFVLAQIKCFFESLMGR